MAPKKPPYNTTISVIETLADLEAALAGEQDGALAAAIAIEGDASGVDYVMQLLPPGSERSYRDEWRFVYHGEDWPLDELAFPLTLLRLYR